MQEAGKVSAHASRGLSKVLGLGSTGRCKMSDASSSWPKPGDRLHCPPESRLWRDIDSSRVLCLATKILRWDFQRLVFDGSEDRHSGWAENRDATVSNLQRYHSSAVDEGYDRRLGFRNVAVHDHVLPCLLSPLTGKDIQNVSDRLLSC